MRDPRFVKALPSIHRKVFTWHPGRDLTAEDILHAAHEAEPLGDTWWGAFLGASIKRARETRTQEQPPVTPYEIGFGEATRIRAERFEREALRGDDLARSEECRCRILASVGAPVAKGW